MVALEEGLQRVVEHPEGRERVLVAVLEVLCRLLEAREHGALAVGGVLAGVALLAQLLHDVLQQAELVAGEGVGGGVVGGVAVAAQVRDGLLEGVEVLDHGGAGVVAGAQQRVGVVGLGQDALLDDLVGIAGGQRQARVEAALDLGEVVAHHGGHLVDGFLAGHHDPHAAMAAGAQVLHERLQVEHEARVVADVLADLVHHEQQAELPAVLGGAALAVLVDVVHELLDREVLGLLAVDPVEGGVLAHHVGVRQGLGHVLGVELVVLAVLDPAHTREGFVFGTKLGRLALVVDEALEARELEVLAVEALVLVEHAGEHAHDDRGVLGGRGLGVDVEQDGLGGDARAADGLAFEQGAVLAQARRQALHGALAVDRLAGQQVGEHLEEVGLTGSEEARDPHADLVRGGVDGAAVGGEEVAEVARELARDHVFGQLLFDVGLVFLTDLDDAVDVAGDVALEHVLDAHGVPLAVMDAGVR